MARLAATDFAADWIFNADADEFWLARGASLKEVLGAVPARFGAVRGAWRNFVPRPDDERLFAERMTARLCTPSFHPHPLSTHFKSAHRAHAGRPHRAREPRGAGRRPGRAPRLVPDRDPPLSRSLVRSMPAKVRHAVRRPRAERRKGDSRAHGGGVRGVPRGPARRLLCPTRRRRRRPRRGARGGHVRSGHPPARRAAHSRVRLHGPPARPRSGASANRGRGCGPVRRRVHVAR